MKKMLIHACCGPCGIYPIKKLREQFEVTAFYYNPNIHPEKEFLKRQRSFKDHCERHGIDHIMDGYDPGEYFSKIRGAEKNKKKRCPLCYELRLEKTAKTAKEKGYDAFTSTLLISPYQDIGRVREIGLRLAGIYGLDFHDGRPEGDKKKYKGFRPGFTEGRRAARQENLYEQTYCGCVYSRKGL